MKQLNFNAVRCSHYPNHPLWYEVCSKLGLYVVGEWGQGWLGWRLLGGHSTSAASWAGTLFGVGGRGVGLRVTRLLKRRSRQRSVSKTCMRGQQCRAVHDTVTVSCRYRSPSAGVTGG